MKRLRIVLIVIFAMVACYSGYRLIDYGIKVYKADKMDEAMLEYRPAIPTPNSDEEDGNGIVPVTDADEENRALFEPILKMHQINSDFIGWLNVYDTKIDFAFAQSKDNDYYLYKDINREYSISGTVFLDYRCQPDFTSQVSVLYGHHMKKSAKFTYLDAFEDQDYLSSHRHLNILLADQYIQSEIFAYAVVPYDSAEAFNALDNGETLVKYLAKNARVYIEPAYEPGDRLIVLATCNYEYSNARAILVSCVKGESIRKAS